jgi:hypothetical protein
MPERFPGCADDLNDAEQLIELEGANTRIASLEAERDNTLKSLHEFEERYDALQQELDAARSALEAARDAVKSLRIGAWPPQVIADRLEDALAGAAPQPCVACGGEGFVNRDYFDDPEREPQGYRTEPCPDCAAPQPEEPEQ